MLPADPDLLEGLADALAGSATPLDALAALEEAGGRARRLARALREGTRAGAPLLAGLRSELALHPHDRALLAAIGDEAGSHAAVVAALRVVAQRIRDRGERARGVLAALGTPLAMVALGVVIAPLPNLVLGGAYLAPVLRDLGVLALVVAALLFAARALLRAPRPFATLSTLAHAPLLGGLARAHLDAGLATVLAPFADGGCVDPAGERAAAALFADDDARARPSLDALAARGSEGLRLLVVTAPMAQRLDLRLARHAAEQTAASSRALRRTVTAAAWVVVLATSVPMLARSLGGGLPTGAGGAIPGLDLDNLKNAQQRELDQILSEPR